MGNDVLLEPGTPSKYEEVDYKSQRYSCIDSQNANMSSSNNSKKQQKKETITRFGIKIDVSKESSEQKTDYDDKTYVARDTIYR